MNSAFRMIPTKSLLFFDIETVRAEKELKVKSESFKAWQYLKRDRETEILPSEEECINLYNRTAALNPIFGKIVCITLGVINNKVIKIKSLVGEEKDILTEFYKIIDVPTISQIVSWNGDSFDLPYCEKRALIDNVKIPDSISGYNKKPWELFKSIDLMKTWKGTGFVSDSLSLVAYALGLENPKDGLNGSQVSEVYWKNPTKNISKISEYCERDVTTLINIFLKLQGKEIITEITK